MDSDIEAKVKKYSHTMPPLGVTRESVGMHGSQTDFDGPFMSYTVDARTRRLNIIIIRNGYPHRDNNNYNHGASAPNLHYTWYP